MRTIVISDAHGHPSLITNALEDAGKYDRFIFAGDALDIGPDPRGVLTLLKEHEAECLLGNHDAAALVGQRIHPQDEVSFVIANENREWMESWGFWAEVDGVTISHAGVVGKTHPHHTIEGESNYDTGLLWARIGQNIRADHLSIRPQVFGHTPRELYDSTTAEALEYQGLYLIDPYARHFYKDMGFDSVPADDWFRYALIEDGTVTVKEAHDGDQSR